VNWLGAGWVGWLGLVGGPGQRLLPKGMCVSLVGLWTQMFHRALGLASVHQTTRESGKAGA